MAEQSAIETPWRIVRVPTAESPTECLPPDGAEGLFYDGDRFDHAVFNRGSMTVTYVDGTVAPISDHDWDGWRPMPEVESLVALWWEARRRAEMGSEADAQR